MNNPFELLEQRLCSIENILLNLKTTRTEQQVLVKSDSDLLTIDDAASFLKLAKPTIYGLVCHSKIPCMKKGKKLYFSQQELTAWLKQGKKKTLAEMQEEAESHLTTKKKRG